MRSGVRFNTGPGNNTCTWFGEVCHSWVRSVIFASKDQDLFIDLDLLCDLDNCG